MLTLVYRQSGQHRVCMPWFTQEGKLVYACLGLHRKANWFMPALDYTGRQTGLHRFHSHESKLVYMHVVHRSTNWVT